jgi:hypothetical protein
MQLDDFISKTLIQIGNGIKAAQAETGGEGGMRINPAGLDKRVSAEPLFWDGKAGLFAERVDFDLLITVSEASTAKGGAELSVAGIGGFGGKGEQTASNSAEQRIRFGVLVVLPTTESPPPPKERASLEKMRNRASARDIAR